MKKVSVLIALLFVSICYSQITVINTGTSDQLTSISKINNNILISGFTSYLAKSYDDCNTLVAVNTPVFMENPQNRYYGTIRMDTNVIYMSYKSSSNWKFYKSINGGNSWVKKQDSTNANLFLVDPTLLFFDTSNAVVVFDYNRTILTANGLTTYTVDWVIGGFGWLSFTNGPGIVFGDSTAIVGETMYGGAYITKNRGKTWQGVGVNGAPRDFEAMNKDTIFYISSPAYTDPSAYFGYSFNGGLTWITKPFLNPTYFLNVCVKNINEIYLLAREGQQANGNGVILKTTDLGQSWTQIVTPFLANLRDMKFLNDSIALVCGDNGLLFKWNTKTAAFVGVKENKSDELFVSVFPNPVKDKLFFRSSNNDPLIAYTSNIFGQSIGEVSFRGQGEIEFSSFPAGVYFVRIKSLSEQKVLKIIKE